MTTPESRAHPHPESRLSRSVAWALLAIPLAFFLATARPDLEGSDSAELVTTAWRLGIAHGTGYPLYVCIGRIALSLSPLDPPATMNLLSALLGAGALLLFALAAREATGNLLLSTIPFVVIASGRAYWYVSTVAEVYALHHLLLGATLLLLFRWRRTGEFRYLALGAYAAALDLGHHGTTVFLVPLYVVFVLTGLPAAGRMKGIAFLLLLAALGLSVYAYLPVRYADGSTAYGFEELSAKAAMGTRKGVRVGESVGERIRYKLLGGGPRRKFSFDAGTIGENLRRFPEQERAALGLPLLAAGALGLAWGLRKPPRAPAALLLGCVLASGAVLAPFRSADWEDFVVPLSLFLGAGAALFFGRIRRWPRLPGAGRVAVALALIAGAGGVVETRNAAEGRGGYAHGGSIVGRERRLLDMDFPEGSHICIPWGRASVLRYLQVVEGVRADLRVHSIGRGSLLAAADYYAGDGAVFVESADGAMAEKYRLEPFGSLLRVFPRESGGGGS